MSCQAEDTPKDKTNKHAKSATDHSRLQLERLMKDPSKPAFLPPPPKEKSIRPPREMIKNVQGSSAGAGSGEFHVYKASRRREYERLKLMEEQKIKEETSAEIERRRREREEDAEAKTAKNRSKRQKKKEAARLKGKGKSAKNANETGASKDGEDDSDSDGGRPAESQPFKKRRLVAEPVAADEQALEPSGVDLEISSTQEPAVELASSNVIIHDED